MTNNKILFTLLFISFSICSFATNEDLLLIDLHTKDYATYNDGICLLRVLYKDTDHNALYLDNMLWAANKKIFKVSIPIHPDKLNPYLTRMEFAYWMCGIYNLSGDILASRPFRYHSYNVCVALGLLEPGSGPLDKMTGQQLLDAFYHLKHYVRARNLKLNPEIESEITDYYDENDYVSYPHWRKVLYKELDNQQNAEKEKREKRKQKIKEKREKEKKQEWEVR